MHLNHAAANSCLAIRVTGDLQEVCSYLPGSHRLGYIVKDADAKFG